MAQVDLHVLIEKEEDLYSAICLELSVASQGKTLEETNKNIREAVVLYLEDVLKAGDEKDFIPRSAPVEEWLKYFKVQAINIKDVYLNIPHNGFKFHEAVYAS
jgi:predicted RNase H-like HicB family nuclease